MIDEDDLWYPETARNCELRAKNGWRAFQFSRLQSGGRLIPFTKAHACGNDFLIVTEDAAAEHDWAELTRRLCARNTGIGADGIEFFRLDRAEVGAHSPAQCRRFDRRDQRQRHALRGGLDGARTRLQARRRSGD
jgi:hypothetical protein